MEIAMNDARPTHEPSDVRRKLSDLDFDFGASLYEPAQSARVAAAALKPARLRAYWARAYGASPKFKPHEANLARILRAEAPELEKLLSVDDSEKFKLLTLSVTLSAAKAGWAALLSYEQAPHSGIGSKNASVSDVVAPIPETSDASAGADDQPDLGLQKALNDGQVRYFFHALTVGLSETLKKQHPELLNASIENLDGSRGLLPSGADRLILRLDQALQRLVRHFHAQRRPNHCSGRPDAGLEEAVGNAKREVLHLLQRAQSNRDLDHLRVRLIMQASVNMALNHVDGILESLREIGQSLSWELERFRRFDYIQLDSEVLPAVALAFGASVQDLPKELIRQANVVRSMYLSNYMPVEPSARSAFVEAHSSPSSLAIAAGLVFDGKRNAAKVTSGIRGQRNPTTNAFNALRAHEARHRERIEAGDLVYLDLPQAAARYWVDRYSIVWNGIGWRDVPVQEAAQALIRIKAFKFRLQSQIYQAVASLSFRDFVELVDGLTARVDEIVGELGAPRSFRQPSSSTT